MLAELAGWIGVSRAAPPPAAALPSSTSAAAPEPEPDLSPTATAAAARELTERCKEGMAQLDERKQRLLKSRPSVRALAHV